MAFSDSIREILHLPNSPLSFHSGIWSVRNRDEVWDQLGSRVFDDMLDAVREIAIGALSEDDPQFELDPDKRFATAIHGKVFTHSRELREGIAETLVLLGSRSNALIHCTVGKAEAIAALVVRQILGEGDWIRWASLNHLLPIIAEAAPSEFLDAVEHGMRSTPCPFDELFAQEGDATYISGLLWAIEGLAWSDEHYGRAMMSLAALAARDNGGKWSNRPSSSMTSILLPWLPQTTASLEKRKAVVGAIHREHPKVAWDLLLSLMPGRSTISSGSHKPKWRLFRPSNWNDGVDRDEYLKQVEMYAQILLESGLEDPDKFPKLIERLDNLPPRALNQILGFIESDKFMEFSNAVRVQTWECLSDVVRKHRRFAGAKWAFPKDIVDHIDTAAEKIEPTNPVEHHRNLFTAHERRLYKEKGNYTEQREQIARDRIQAVNRIIDHSGFAGVLGFVGTVDAPRVVGLALGQTDRDEADRWVLPDHLLAESEPRQAMAGGFVIGRWLRQGWDWIESIDRSDWSREQVAQFMMNLPFVPKTWEKVESELAEHKSLYWSSVGVNPYEQDCDINLAAKYLTEHERPKAAVRCLVAKPDNQSEIDPGLAAQALIEAAYSDESAYSTDTYELVELIQFLQNRDGFDRSTIIRIEVIYLSILDQYNGASPVVLESLLATDPDAFCEIIQTIYRSRSESEEKKSPTPEEQKQAEKAYLLLHEWSLPPGTNPDGTFSDEAFVKWLDRVVEVTTDSGHLEVAMQAVGGVLIHAHRADDGLVLRHAIAEAANREEMDELRKGYCLALFNSRGAHWVDPTGKPEIELAEKYEGQADQLEKAGYFRLAASLRNLAEQYHHEAKRLQSRKPTDDL